MTDSLEGDGMQIRVERVQGANGVDREALRQQIRQSVEQAVRDGQQAAAEGSRAAAEGARAAAEGARAASAGGGFQVQIDPPLPPGGAHPGTAVQFPTDIPPGVESISYMFFVTVAAILILRPLMSAFGRRLERRPNAAAALPAETSQQIARIEQTVEAMAIEIERISEGQRFAAKLLAEREKLPN